MPSSAQLQEGQGVGRRKRQLQGGEGPCFSPSPFTPPATGEDTWEIPQHPVAFSMGLDSPAFKKEGANGSKFLGFTETFSTEELAKQRHWEEWGRESRKLSVGASEQKQSRGNTRADMTIIPGDGGSFLSKRSWGKDSVAWKKG